MAKRRRKDPLAPLSMQELYRQADLLLNAGLGRPRAQIKRAQEQARREAQEDAAAIQAFSTALLGVTGQSRLGAEQTASAGRQAALSQGFAAAGQQAEQSAADRANAILGAQGGPQQVGVGPLSGVTGYLGGLGASGLRESGENLANYAQGVQGSIGGRAQLQMQQRFSEGQKEQMKYREQLEDLLAQVPGKRQEILNALLSHELSKRAARTQEGYLLNAQGQTLLEEQQTIDPTTGLPYSYLSDTTSGKGKKKKDQEKAIIKARKARLDALATNKDKAWTFAYQLSQRTKKVPGLADQPSPPKPKEAFNALWARFGSGLMRYAPKGHRAWWQRQITEMIWGALENNGFERPMVKRRGGGPGAPPGVTGPVK